MRSIAFPFLTAAVVLPLATGVAQVPAGWCAVSSFGVLPTYPSGGICIMPADQPATPVPVTGLPPTLIWTGVSFRGAGSVLVNPCNGDLIVGEHAVPGQTMQIHVIQLAGAAVTSVASYPIGVCTGTGYGSTDQMAWFGDDIVFSNRRGQVSGPMANVPVGILRPSLGPPGTPGTVLPLPFTTNPVGTTNALCVDPQRQEVYVATLVAAGTDIHRAPINRVGSPVTPTLVTTLTGMVTQLAIDNNGMLIASIANAPLYYQIDPRTTPPTVAAIATPSISVIHALAMETATCALLVSDTTTGWIYRIPPGGAPIALAQTSGWYSGIALNPSLATYGTACPGANTYDWQIAPNPGGIPTVGNANFGLTLQSSPGSAPGFLFLSLGQASLPMFGCTLLLDPAALVPHGLLLPPSPQSVQLPIPNQPSLRGLTLYAQTAHLDPNGIATSDGLRFTIF